MRHFLIAGPSLTYLGTADDVVFRYPWRFPINGQSLNEQLLHAAIYSQELALNDGYLVTNPSLLPALEDVNESLLGSLMKAGSVRLFCRGKPQDIAKGIQISAEEKEIPTHMALVKSKQWPSVRDSLETLNRYTSIDAIQWPTDKNMSEVFHRLLESIFSSPNHKEMVPEGRGSDLKQIFKRYLKQIDKKTFNGARTEWEYACWKHFLGRKVEPTDPLLKSYPAYEDVRIFMQMANEIYHSAYTCGMWYALNAQGNIAKGSTDLPNVQLQTAFCPGFNELFDMEWEPELGQEIDLAGLDQLLLSIRPLKFKRNAKFGALQNIRDNREIRELRQKYINMIRDFSNERKDGTGQKERLELRNEYAEALAKLLTPAVQRPFLSKIGQFLTGQVFAKSVSKISTVTHPMFGLLVSYFSDYFNTWLFEVKLQEKYVESSLIREGIAHTQAGIPGQLARDLGLLHSPVSAKAGMQLMQSIKPFPG